MRKLVWIVVLLTMGSAAAVADQVTFSFVIGAPGTVTATPGGFTSGPSMNVLVSDSTTGASFSLDGTFTGSAGASTAFNAFPAFVIATYAGAGANSVLIVDSMGHPLVAGAMNDNATFFTAIPDGAGSFIGSFTPSFVSPAVLALFGLGPAFNPNGSVSETFAHDNFDPTTETVSGQIGGGTVTVTTPTPAIPEPSGLGLAGMGLLGAAIVARRQWHT